MTFQEVLQYVHAEPFHPFRIYMAGGRTFDVRHPEMIRVGLTFVVVFDFTEQDERVVENVDMLGLSLIESLELLEAPVA